jgi:hypothetical protein
MLFRNHPGYADVVIDENHLRTYTNGIPDSLARQASEIVDPIQRDAASEVGVQPTPTLSAEDGPSINDFQTSFLFDRPADAVPVQDIMNELQENISSTSFLARASKRTLDQTTAMLTGNTIIGPSNASFYVAAYPTLFPFGTGSPTCDRPTALTLKECAKYLLSIRSDVFRHHASFQFAMFDSMRKSELFESVKLSVKRFSNAHLSNLAAVTVEDLQDALRLSNSTSFVPSAHPASRLMSAVKLVGSHMKYSDYFKSTCRSEIKSSILHHGSPSLYITISPLDHCHVLAYSMCKRDVALDLNNLPEELSDDQFRVKQAANNPVALAEFFHVVVTSILSTLFGRDHSNKQGIFGTFQSYYGMVEAQNRGTLHIHLVLWIQGAPPPDVLYDKLSNDFQFQTSLFNYLDSTIKNDLDDFTAVGGESLPATLARTRARRPILTPSELFDEAHIETRNEFFTQAAAEYQTHVHTSSCYKNARTAGKCRMRMPAPLHEATSFDLNSGEITQKRAHGMINAFNPLLTGLANCNTDVTYLFRCKSALSVIHYITMYITKSDDQVDNFYALVTASKQSLTVTPMQSAVTDLSPDQMSVRSLLLRVYHKAYNSTQIGGNIVATLLLDLPMSYKSDEYYFLSSGR